MKKRFNRRRINRRRSRMGLSSRNRGSVLKRVAVVLGALIALVAVATAGLFAAEKLFKIENPLKKLAFVQTWSAKNDQQQSTPAPEAEPTPHPMSGFDCESAEKELVFPSEMNYAYLGEPYCFGGSLVCPVGKSNDGRVRLNKLIKYDIDTKKVEEMKVESANGHIISPVFNEKWLVYLDANYNAGGGSIMAVDLSDQSKKPTLIKKVYAGQPQLKLDGDTLAWIERTGSDRDKIFVCDLKSQESVVVQYFDRSTYGTSMPSLGASHLVYASDGENAASSTIKYIDLETGEAKEYLPSSYVHDPEFNGFCFAWLDSNHAPGAKLVFSDMRSSPLTAAENVTEFSLQQRFIAYGMNDAVYAYFFETGESYRLIPSWEKAQFMGASNGVVMWMDVTSRERDIIKYLDMNSILQDNQKLSTENEG